MKQLWVFLASLFILSGAMAQTGVAVNEDRTDPDASAILDLSSTDKGMLVPRMSASNRTSITAPATGLLVYDTDSAAYYYYDGGWNRVANQHQLGGTTNYSEFEDDGTLVFNGSATTWNDLMVPGTSTLKNESPPGFETFLDGTLAYAFDNNSVEQVYFTVQLPHTWKEGSTIYPHIHHAPSDATSGTIRWVLEYTWADISGTFPSTDTLVAEVAVEGTAYQHYVNGFGGITPDTNQDNISSMLVCRLAREGNDAADDYGSDVFFLQFDIHYEINTPGSRQQWTK